MKKVQKKRQEQNLSKNIGKVISVVMIVVFLVLTSVTATLVSSSLTDAIDDVVAGNAQNTANQIQDIIETVQRTGNDMMAYLEKAYRLEGEGYDNMAREHIADTDTRTYQSVIYGETISELNADVEKYITETARTAVLENDTITGIGMMFHPYKLDANIKSYAFYLTNEIGADGIIEPFGEYEEYSKENYYQDAVKSKKPVFTDPYEYDGQLLITYAVPILYNGEVQGVIMVDIDSSYFGNAIVMQEEYPSMYNPI